jgi:hypothetical protein
MDPEFLEPIMIVFLNPIGALPIPPNPARALVWQSRNKSLSNTAEKYGSRAKKDVGVHSFLRYQ